MPKGIHLPRAKKTCPRCGKEFTHPASDTDRKHCSWECARPRKIPPTERKCEYCGIAFIARAHKPKSSPQRWCSTSCHARHLSDLKRASYRTKSIFPNNRVAKEELIARFGECQRCGFSDKRILEVHHKDRNNRNNHIDNLRILCPNCHTLYHYLASDGQFKNNVGRPKKQT